MRFMHLSDLHLGKKVNGYSMIEDQKYIINNILEIIDNENIESVITVSYTHLFCRDTGRVAKREKALK